MFNNTVTLKEVNNSGVEVGVIDYSQKGRVVRKNGTGDSLITATQVSRENKGIDTGRTLVRAEITSLVDQNGVPTPVTAHVSVIISQPKDSAGTFNDGLMHNLLCRAVTFIEKGDAPSAIGLTATPVDTHLSRLIAGEL